MKRVLMVSPHFPPDSSAAAHRVRLLAPHLAEAGWRPTVVTVDRSAYEGRLEPALEALVPADLDVVRAPAWPARATRAVGLGDLGIRAFEGLRGVCRRVLAASRYDALFITVYPVYPALLGARLKREFGVPFVLDYQDPWVGEWGRTVGGRADGGPDWKSRASRRLGQWLEPRAVSAADALVAVSQGTIDGIVERIPEAAGLPQRVIPLGFETSDFDRLSRMPRAPLPWSSDDDRLVHLSYVGTLLPAGSETLRLLLTALRTAREQSPRAMQLRLHFVGTSNQSTADRLRVMPMAESLGVDAAVTEHPARVGYFDALSILTRSSAILQLGSSERHYTASKLYPALLARRPLIALFHESSSVVSILRDVARAPAVRLVTYQRDIVTEERVAAVAGLLEEIAGDSRYDAEAVDFARAASLSARSLSARLASLLDEVAA
jgi:glycosyltransferase involved in cell wall biosynthesis